MNLSRRKPWTRPMPLVPKASTRREDPVGPARSTSHLARVRQQPCLACRPGAQQSPTEAHHCRHLSPRTLGKRVSDFLTVPLCGWHHQIGPDALHRGDEASWWEAVGIDPREFIRRSSREGAELLEALNDG